MNNPHKFFCLIIIFLLGIFIACSKKQPAIREKADRVLVFKSKRKMQLLKDNKVLRTYSIALGASPDGHKSQEGDEKTPEGRYTLDWRNAKSSCYKSLHVSYPNEKDRKSADEKGVSPGGMIMIHGLHPSIKWAGGFHTLYDWTNGCIGVTNAEMDEIWKTVPDGTIIEIKP
ncbi:L,D-transpeptidase family protein [Cytophagaceae bacterium YF14B1]|uniref:L,D-transpeptidase family protein n=1 Tax=Xanthocytophaga flava TaxID=3048013 RepID=A0AAE3QXI5_9BACT|nr:L,D-transpeptidase family protein [Xanthocytophaga flavus]MDJ1484569.1 L,D-transpeptidase family protein [Xanthocytophaga flavus]